MGKLRALCKALVLIGLTVGCETTRPVRGGVMVRVAVPSAGLVEQVTISVYQGTSDLGELLKEVTVDRESLPNTVSIVSNGDPLASLYVRVLGRSFPGEDGEREVVDVREATVREVPVDTVVTLDLALAKNCRALTADGRTLCGPRKTCSPETGKCVSSQLLGVDLPPFVAEPPPKPFGLPARSKAKGVPSGKVKSRWWVTTKTQLGAGEGPATSWRKLGVDLDGRCTSFLDSRAENSACRKPLGASLDSLSDGDDCRDNNFGSRIVNRLGLLDSSVSGQFVLFRIDDLDDLSNDAYAPGSLYYGGQDFFGRIGIYGISVFDKDIDKPVLRFPDGYVRDGVWISGEPAPLRVPVVVQGLIFDFSLVQAQLFSRLTDDSTVTFQVAGVAPTTQLLKSLAPLISRVACPGKVLHESLVDYVRQSSDVMVIPGSTGECDGVSIGVAYETAVTTAPTILANPFPPPTSPCKPGS